MADASPYEAATGPHPGRVSEQPPVSSVELVLQHMTDEFAEQFAGVFARETIGRYVHESYMSLFRTAKVKTHLPTFTYRFARERLTALAQHQGAIVKDVPEVLFVCVHNAGRSQMAAALLDHYAAGRVHVRSAGSAPADTVNPAVAEALSEVGLDISREFPKPLTDDVARASDVLVTMGCGDACPVYPGKRYLDWELDDPAGQPVETVRRIRDEIDGRVRALLIELVPGTELPPSLAAAEG
jgi:protein-tyrosine-phosphatase